MPKRPTLVPCPLCGVKLMKHRGGPHGLAHHECLSVTPEMRLTVHKHVMGAVMADELTGQQAQTVMLKMLVLRAYEDGSGVREIGEALEKVNKAIGSQGGAVSEGFGFFDDDED